MRFKNVILIVSTSALMACGGNGASNSSTQTQIPTPIQQKPLAFQEVNAWVNENESIITVKSNKSNATAYLSSDSSCDIKQITSCENGTSGPIKKSLKNTAFTQAQTGFLTLKENDQSKAIELSQARFSGRKNHQVVEHNDRLFVIGGQLDLGQKLNDVWSSKDGINWIKETPKAAFSARKNMQLTSFNNQIWLIGGEDSSGEVNDVWSSKDGKTWQKINDDIGQDINESKLVVLKNKMGFISKEDPKSILTSQDGIHWKSVSNDFEPTSETEYDFVSLDQTLWAFGKSKDDKHNNVWRSDNFSHWEKVTDHAHFDGHDEHHHNKVTITPYHGGHQHEALHLVAHNQKLWLIGGSQEGQKNEILSSSDGEDWDLINLSSNFGTEAGYQVISFKNKLFFIGGRGVAGPSNQIWSSTDGTAWNVESSNPNLTQRNNYPVVVFNGYLWAIGGVDYSSAFKNDVWRSNDGLTWELITDKAQFSARGSHQVIVFKNKLWVIGGQGKTSQGVSTLNDVWSSEDGKVWTQVTEHAEFSPRNSHQTITLGDSLLVIGGVSGWNIQKDVWSSQDGQTWTKLTEEAEFGARTDPEVVKLDDTLYLIGGMDQNSFQNTNDVWSSRDGKKWERITPQAPFSARAGFRVTTFNNQLILSGGVAQDFNTGMQFKSDVWRSTDGKNWEELNIDNGYNGRSQHNLIEYEGSLWVFGGFINQPVNDVWKTQDGKNWFKGYSVNYTSL